MPAPQFRRYLRRISRHQQRGYIFHYDSTVRDLRIWYWPLSDADERIAPADLPNFRLTHEFRAPCCLCACQDVEGNYTEAAMFIAEDGPNWGKYMAGCASKHCGYLICIDNMYTKINLLGRQFSLRSAGVPAPLPILYLPTNNTSDIASVSEATYGSRQQRYAPIPSFNPRPRRGPATAAEKFLKLDSWGRAGLLEGEFKKLFAKCACGLVMTRRVFPDHDCAIVVAPGMVVDLTSDSEGDDSVIDLVDEV